MTRKEIIKLKSEDKQYKPVSISVSLISILYGLFIFYYQGYFFGVLPIAINDVPSYVFAVPLILLGLLKLIGIYTGNRHIRRLAVIGLAAIWGGLFTVNFVYAFGEGYPNPMWLFMGRVVIDCGILAVKGRYD